MTKRKIYTVFMAVASAVPIFLSACTQETQPLSPVSYTLMIYMCGSDLESVRGYASANIADILKADIRTGQT